MLKLYFIVAGIVITLGFTSAPIIPRNLDRGPIWLNLLVWLVAISPLLPLMIALIHAALRAPANKLLSKGLAVLFGIWGTLISLLFAAFSGTGTSIVLIHGLALTVAMVASLLLLSAPRNSSPLKAKPLLAMIGPTIVAIWSLASLGAIVWQARTLSGNRPYCLAPHTPSASNIQSIAQLRGLAFYSTLSGYKSTSRWYFHGLLIVEKDGNREIYNWSPRRMRFDLVEHPERLVVPPTNACTPQEGFFKTLPVW